MIKIALPAGDLRGALAELLSSVGLRVEGYGEGSRSYRLPLPGHDDVATRVFRERDIPIQVALGNYDLGVCSLAWAKEMQARFKRQPIVALCDLGVGAADLFVACSSSIGGSMGALGTLPIVRIASEYPNLANAFASAARLRRYRVQSVWGAAEAYPPEDADCVIVSAVDEAEVRKSNLLPLFRLLESSAWLIANAEAFANRDLSAILTLLTSRSRAHGKLPHVASPPPLTNGVKAAIAPRRDVLRLAVPDGHQQRHAVAAIRDAGLQFGGYDESTTVRRPRSPIEGLEVKVIRPHDMPQLIATGAIDIAITGRDCLNEHLYSFPSSPATEILDLRRGQYNLSAVVTDDLPAESIGEALDHWRGGGKPLLRIASEFPATADHYARSRHFWRYQVIPIAGASEGFVPEDADLLIEGTETGRTLAENKLKPIDLLYRSTTCVIGHKDASFSGERRDAFNELLSALRGASDIAELV